MKLHNLTIQTKILLALVITFTVLLVTTAVFISTNQRNLVTELAREKVDALANTYFDGVNTMMLTGTTTQRGILRDKILGENGVEEVSILRSKAIVDVFGKGLEHESAESEHDKKAMQGEQFQIMQDTDHGRKITTWIPLAASSDYRGTNCLTCHQVPEGTILGVVKASYSLAEIDKKVSHTILVSTLLSIVLFVAAIAIIIWLLRNILVKPIQQYRHTMHQIQDNCNLMIRLPIKSEDELGMLANAFNRMLDAFHESIQSVRETAHQVTDSANQISRLSETTLGAAQSQQSQTGNIATAINELSASAVEVNNSANSTQQASISADEESSAGAEMAASAVQGIHHLIGEIENASSVINQLDTRSQDVGQVLDVIRNIAEQTNLLALNAAIEAARAGEMGRGFAVVADEVRTLATRSHEATKEIQQLIEQLQDDAKKAVGAMSNARESAAERGTQIEAAGTSLRSIAERVSEIKNLNTQMANAATEQSRVTEDVSKNITTISEIAENTCEDTQQVNDFSQNLVQLSVKLTQLVDRFKV
ncbi:MAG: methyl-accepting chemotaxis protein [Chromatiales bacterium]|jgi:methyl-accepting chemotaxis protein